MTATTANIYENIVGLLTGQATKYLGDLAGNLATATTTSVLINFIFTLLLIMWVIKRFSQLEDFFSIKNAIQIIIFFFYVGFFNYFLQNIQLMMDQFQTIINYPSTLVTDKVASSISNDPNIQNLNGGLGRGISVLTGQIFHICLDLGSNVFEAIGISNIGKMLLSAILVLGVMIFQGAFLLLVMIMIIITTLEITFWLGMFPIILPLAFFKATRGMMIAYFKKIFSLTFYKPLIFAVAFLDLSILNTIIRSLPNSSDIERGVFDFKDFITNNISQTIQVSAYLVMILFVSFLIFSLIKRIPDVINFVFQTSGGMGDISSFISQSAMKITSSSAGIGAGALGARMKNAYSESGGGIGGIAGAMNSFLTGGIGSGAIGREINSKVNASNTGSKLNDAITKGVNFSSKIIKGDK